MRGSLFLWDYARRPYRPWFSEKRAYGRRFSDTAVNGEHPFAIALYCGGANICFHEHLFSRTFVLTNICSIFRSPRSIISQNCVENMNKTCEFCEKIMFFCQELKIFLDFLLVLW